MKKYVKRLLAVILVVIMISGMFSFSAGAANATDIYTQIDSFGFTATIAGDTINVIGGTINTTTTLALNLNPEVIINWTGATLTNTSGNAALALSGSGTFNLNSGSISNTGTGGAITISGGIINISGGNVSSLPSGLAIFDNGANTSVNVTAGSVTAGNSSAIQSNGAASVVTISGGAVRNAATSNINPTINMTAGSSVYNVIVRSGLVETTNTSNTSYVIQTAGNVLVENTGVVKALAGRAINLVGMDSIARVTGGTVSATSGIAISTATTAPTTVRNASIIVEGGKVFTGTGTAAIQTTGTNGDVTITGGQVYATTGLAVKATRNAIITGGFVFAYGTTIGQVVSAANPSGFPSNNGVVVSWNNATLNPTYIEDTNNDLTILPEGSAKWGLNSPDDGIYYEMIVGSGSYSGFFPLAGVTVRSADIKAEGLIFDIVSGAFYIGSVGGSTFGIPASPTFWDWSSGTSTLTLDGFSWVTDAPIALTIVGGTDITIHLIGDSTFASIAPPVTGVTGNGILSNEANITITGTGALNASASAGIGMNMGSRSLTMNGGKVFAASGNLTNAHGLNVGSLVIIDGELYASSSGTATSGAVYGINASSLEIREGKGLLIASGNSRAITSSGLTLPGGYYYEIGSRVDGSNVTEYSYPADSAYSHSNSNRRFVHIQARMRHTLTVINGSVSGSYFAGETVPISANNAALVLTSPAETIGLGPIITTLRPPYAYPQSFNIFTSWENSSGGGSITNSTSAVTTFIMPDNAASITAKTDTAYKLYIRGSGRIRPYPTNPNIGYYLEGAVIPIGTNMTSGSNLIFDGWEFYLTVRNSPEGPVYDYTPSGFEFANPENFYTTITMPDSNVIIEPIWSTTPSHFTAYTLTVVNGTGSYGSGSIDSVMAGTWVTLEADPPLEVWQEFSHWEITVPVTGGGYRGALNDPSSNNTSFIMGEGDITVTASYTSIIYNLTVVDSLGRIQSTEQYIYGDEVTITANPTLGQTFIKWSVNSDASGTVAQALTQEDFEISPLVFYMPACDVTIMVYYTIEYELNVIDGTGSGSYYSGDWVHISAEAVPGQEFDGWSIVSGGGTITNFGAMQSTYIMPSSDATIIARFRPLDSGSNEYEPEPPGGTQVDPPPVTGGNGDVSHWLNIHDHMSYIRGVGENLFEPDRFMTRAEAAQLFYNLLVSKDVGITESFPDIPDGSWYEEAVGTLASIGFITGYPDGSFRPNTYITRAEFVTMTVRFAKELPIVMKPLPFADVPDNHWALINIDAAVQYGWVIGYGDGRFAPEDFINRAEVVTLVNRMLVRVPDQEFINGHPELLRFIDVPQAYWQYYGIMEAFHAHDYVRVRQGSGDERWLRILNE